MKYSIYRIFHEDSSLGAYIGSSNNFQQRIRKHRYDCKHNIPIPAYSVINANGGFDSWKTEVIEEIETENREEARKREQYWIENTENKLNKKNEKPFDINAYMIKWYGKHRADILSKKKDYYKTNREKRLAYQRAYNEKKKSNTIVNNDCENNEIASQD